MPRTKTKRDTRNLTDDELIRLGLIEVLAQRFASKGFCVMEVLANGVRRYIAWVDTRDGEIEWTEDPRQARLFRGVEWAEILARPHWALIVPEGPNPGQQGLKQRE